MTSTRRTLTIDDPLAAADACHVARSAGKQRGPAVRDSRSTRSVPTRSSRGDASTRIRSLALAGLDPGARRAATGHRPAARTRGVRADRRRAPLASLPDRRAADDSRHSLTMPLTTPCSLELALIENIARADLTVIEEARTIASLLDDLNVSRADLARRLGRSRSDLAHTVRLLELPDQAIDLIDSGRLTKGHGKALLTEPDHDRRRQLAHRAAESGWSVRNLEAEIIRGAKPRQARAAPHPDHVAAAATLEDTHKPCAGNRHTSESSPARIPAAAGPSRRAPSRAAARTCSCRR